MRNNPSNLQRCKTLIMVASVFHLATAISNASPQDTNSASATSDVGKKTSSTWELDNKHSSVIFAVSNNGLSYIYGRFKSCSGTIDLDLNKPEAAQFHFEIDPRTVDTNEFTRDLKLRGPNFFDVAEFESIEFDSFQVEVKDNMSTDGKKRRTFVASGNFLMHGETRKIVMPLELLAVGEGPDGDLRCGFISKFVVRRSDHGMEKMADSIGDSIAVTFSFQAVKKVEKENGKVSDSGGPQFNVFEPAQSPELNEKNAESAKAGSDSGDNLIDR